MSRRKKPSIAVLGSRGRLGQSFKQILGDNAIYFPKEKWDITSPSQSAAMMRKVKPSVLINCAAYVLVDRAECEPERAFAVNALGPLTLRKLCEEQETYLIHISTDYVFAGEKKRPYHEQDKPAPCNFYGLSKWLGETLVQSYPNHLIARTSALFGQATQSRKKDFVVQIVEKAEREKQIEVIQNIVSPSYTRDVGSAIQKLLKRKTKGIVHIANRGKTSWHALAHFLIRKAGFRTKVVPLQKPPKRTVALRPFSTPLTSTRLPKMSICLPPWQDAVQRYLAELGILQ